VPLADQNMLLLVPRGHRLARAAEVGLRDLKDEPVIYREHGSNTQRTLEARLRKARLELRPIMTVGSREAVMESVSRGIGIGFIFSHERNEDTRSVAIPIRELRGSNRNTLVYLKPRRRRRTVGALIEIAEAMRMKR
jgi:DNA-binding transcriptional LysR family regulator